MERSNEIHGSNYNNTIERLFVDKVSNEDFCNKLISLDVNDNFDVFMNNDEKYAELFNYCVEYLDRDNTDKDYIWKQIELIIDSKR